MFESTFEKCLIQPSIELIQLDIVYDSLDYTEYRVESALTESWIKHFSKVDSNIGKYLDLGSVFLSVYLKTSLKLCKFLSLLSFAWYARKPLNPKLPRHVMIWLWRTFRPRHFLVDQKFVCPTKILLHLNQIAVGVFQP